MPSGASSNVARPIGGKALSVRNVRQPRKRGKRIQASDLEAAVATEDRVDESTDRPDITLAEVFEETTRNDNKTLERPASNEIDLSVGDAPVDAVIVAVEQASSAKGKQGPPAPRAPSLIGNLEEVGYDRIWGWAWDSTRPDEAVDIEILDSDVVVLRVCATSSDLTWWTP